MDPKELHERAEKLEEDLRKVGIYSDSTYDMRWIDPSGMEHGEDDDSEGNVADERDDVDERAKGAKKTSYILMAAGQIGDVAFSSRVQNPEQADMDAEFRIMANELRKDEFNNKQSSIMDDLDKLMGN